MKYIVLTFFAFTLAFKSFSQKNIEDKSASSIFLQGMFLKYDKKYEEAIQLYEKVSINDTNYSAAQIEIADCYYFQDDFKNAQVVLNDLLDLNLPYSKKHVAYKLLGLSYEKDRQFDKALEVYNKGIELFPYCYGLYSNRGYSYENAEKHNESVKDYMKALVLNPSSAISHFHLGMYAAHEGMYAEAILSLTTYLLLDPGSQRAQEALVTIEQLSDLSFVPKPKNLIWSEDVDGFEAINKAIKEKTIVGNKKMKFTIPTIFGDQLNAILSQCKYQKDNEGFWNQSYLRFYQEIAANNRVDELVQFMLKSSMDEVIQKKIKKRAAKIDVFLSWIQTLWVNSIQYQYMEFEGTKQHVLVEYNKAGIAGFGKVDEDNNLTGMWYILYPNGSVSIKASYGQESKPEGLWVWYNVYNGKIKNTAMYKDGEANGDAFYYFYSGELSQKKHFRDNELEDTIYSYYRSGDLYEKYAVSGGKKNGRIVGYYENGKLNYEYSFVIGFAQGPYKKYYPNGQLEDEFNLVNDQIEGLRTKYYPNGAKMSEVNYKNDFIDGTSKSWFINGKLEEEKNYKEGKQIGKFAEYYSNGNLSFGGELDETGKQNGTSISYDYDGVKYEEQDFKKGELIEIRSYNKKGEIIHKSSKKGKKLDFVAHYPNGNKRSEGVYEEDVRVGKWTYYDKKGNIESVESYENGYLTDTIYDYFANGKVKVLSVYNYGERDGLYLKYNIFDTLIEEGNYNNGVIDRDWYTYNLDGGKVGEYYYSDGYEQGIQKTFCVNGKLESWKEIELGKVVSQLFLDTNENKIDQFGQFHGEVKLHDASNNYIRYKGMFKNGVADGRANWFGIDGSILTEGNFINDEKDGLWKWYYEPGKVMKEVEFLMGREHGAYKLYHPNGKLSFEATYVSGNIEGVAKDYYLNGALSYEANFMDGERHGKTVYYDYSGNVMLIRYYDNGEFISYSYLDSTGKEVEPIKLTTGNNLIVSYYKNGQKATEHNRKNGLIEGKYVEYGFDGKVISEEMYENGLPHGKFSEYDEKGTLIYEVTNKVDEHHGVEKRYYPNGTIQEETTYLYGEKHGESKKYSVDGKLIQTITYYNGESVKLVSSH